MVPLRWQSGPASNKFSFFFHENNSVLNHRRLKLEKYEAHIIIKLFERAGALLVAGGVAERSVAVPSSCSPWKCSEGREIWFSLAANVRSSVALNGPLILAGGGIFPGPSEFCFVLVFFIENGPGPPSLYISPDDAGIGKHPNLLTSKVNSWGPQEQPPRPFGFVDSEVLLKMLCFLEVRARPNKKPGR